jgi:hypothetical protein
VVRSGHFFRSFSGYHQDVGDYDPYRFGLRIAPLPVEGELPPSLRLVEDDDDDLLMHRIPPHMRMLAMGIALLFGFATAATAFLTAGTSSLLVQTGPPAHPESNGSR